MKNILRGGVAVKKVAFGFIGLAIIAAIVFGVIQIAGKPHSIATPAPQSQVTEPTPEPVVETPKPVIPEKPILAVEDQGGRLLVDDEFWKDFVVDPQNRGHFSGFAKNIPEGTLIYAPADGYIVNLTMDDQPSVIFIPGKLPEPRSLRQIGLGVFISNIQVVSPDYTSFKKGNVIGKARKASLPLFRDFDSSFNFGFAFANPLGTELEKYARPTTAREVLLGALKVSADLQK